jgi:hypothetical protein
MAMRGDRVRLVRRVVYVYPRGASRSALPVKQASVTSGYASLGARIAEKASAHKISDR